MDTGRLMLTFLCSSVFANTLFNSNASLSFTMNRNIIWKEIYQCTTVHIWNTKKKRKKSKSKCSHFPVFTLTLGHTHSRFETFTHTHCDPNRERKKGGARGRKGEEVLASVITVAVVSSTIRALDTLVSLACT